MGVKNDEMASASGFANRYLSFKTASRGQYRSLLICRSSPIRSKGVIAGNGQCVSKKKTERVSGYLTLSVEKFVRVLARESQAAWYVTHELHYLCNVVIVFAVPRTRCRIEEVVTTCY